MQDKRECKDSSNTLLQQKSLREALQGNVAHTACEGLVWVMRSHEEIRKKPKILSRTTSAALQA